MCNYAAIVLFYDTVVYQVKVSERKPFAELLTVQLQWHCMERNKQNYKTYISFCFQILFIFSIFILLFYHNLDLSLVILLF